MRPSRLLVALPLAAALSFAGLVGEGASALPLAVKAVDGGVPAAAATAPAAPAKPVLSGHGATSIDVRWATPASDGGAPVSGYAVRYGITGSSTRLLRLGGDVLATRLTGLTAHGRYKVTVQAENGVGLSAPSVVARLRLQKPNRVARPAVRAGSSSTITARWTAPKTAGGPAVIAYQVRLYRSGHLTKAVSVAPSRRSVTVKGLRASTRYTVGVRARNAVGWGATSHGAVVTTKPLSAVRRWAKARFGTFAARTYHGTGDEVVTLPAGVKAGIVTGNYHGDDNFIAYTLDSSNQEDDLVANAIGDYTGSRAFGVQSASSARRIKVQTSGSWTLRVAPVWSAAALPRSANKDGVFLYGGRAAVAHFSASGDSNFIVEQFDSPTDDWNLVVNQIAPYSGSGALYRGPSVVSVEADAHWTSRIG